MDTTQVTATMPAAEDPTSQSAPRPSARPILRGVQITIAALAIAGAVIGAILFDSDGAAWLWEGRWLVRELLPGTVTFAVVGVLVLRHPRAAAVGWAMLIFALCWGGSALAAGLFDVSLAAGWSSSAEFFLASHFLNNLGAFAGIVLLPQLFPTGWLSGWGWRALLVVNAVLLVVLLALDASINRESYLPGETALLELHQVQLYALVVWYVAVLSVLATLVERVRRGPQLVRQQVAPFTIAWLLTIAGDELRESSGSSSAWAYLAVWLWPVAVAVVIGVTATQVGLWDTRLVVRRFAVYVVVVAILTAVFAGVYFAMLLVLSSQAVDDRSRWWALLIAAVAVIATDPLRRRVQASLERRLLGERGEPLRPLARLDALSSATDADDEQVYRTITETTAQAVRAPGAALALHQSSLHQPSGLSVVGSTGTLTDAPVVIPLLHRGERLGELQVARRTPGESYGRRDQALLDRLAHQIAALVYGLRRDSDITTLRSEAIEALVEQRTALGRDLHDGLAPLLAGAGLTAEALRRGMPTDSPDAEEAARLASRLRTAASEIRRISHDLQPGPDGPRLISVITDYVASIAGEEAPEFTVTLDESAGSGLSAIAELALSRVALEAITNVVRHAAATHAEVSLQRIGSEVELRVSDDGRGIAQPYVSGLGITSMRSRVQALGGFFELTPREGGGTVLLAHVPVRDDRTGATGKAAG